ncbi:dihydrodipicolinate synthase family protein [Pendulispora rubella]
MIPAMTTPFNADLTVDHGALGEQCRWLADQGVAGVVPLGSLGEGATLTHSEKRQILETCVRAVSDRVAVLPGIFAVSTPEAVALAKHARAVGCRGLMILPPYVYGVDTREIQTHIAAVLSATDLRCIYYNNPTAYRTDLLPEQITVLAHAFPNLEAVRESHSDVARIPALRDLLGDRLEVLAGHDETVVDSIRAGAVGWISGLINVFPAECVALHRYAIAGREASREFETLHEWFRPLMQLGQGPKVIQLAKLMLEKIGRGNARVRPPRLQLEGETLREALAVIDHALATRPHVQEGARFQTLTIGHHYKGEAVGIRM